MFTVQKFLKFPDKYQLKVDTEKRKRFLLDIEFPTYVVKARLCIQKRAFAICAYLSSLEQPGGQADLLFLPSTKLQPLLYI